MVRFAAVAAKFGKVGSPYAGPPVSNRTANQLSGRSIEAVPWKR
jgi:hypothetical protein